MVLPVILPPDNELNNIPPPACFDTLSEIRQLMMLGDDPRTSTRLDLIEWTQPISPPASPPQANALGVPRLALWTSNVQQAYEELQSTGVEFISEPIGGTPEHGVANMVCCRDPDGLLIELIEFLPGAGETQSDH